MPPNKQSYMRILGTTGLKQTGGFVYEEFLYRLRGRNGVKVYREMSENNSVVGSILFHIDMLVRKVNWTVQTPQGMEDDPKAIEQKEFLESVILDMDHTWEDFISEVISMIPYGWVYFEKVFKLRRGNTRDPKTRSQFNDGKWGWRKFDIRGQETLWRWEFGEDNEILGMVQQDTWNPAKGNPLIPIEKSLLFRTRVMKNNPEGYSLLRPAVRDWFFLKRIQEIEAIGIERDLAGMPIMEVPADILSTEAPPEAQALRSDLETMIQQVRVDERWGGLIPSELDCDGNPTGFKFRLQTTGGKRMIDTNEIIKRYESRIAMAFSAEFIMIGMDKVGTESLHSGKTSMFKMAMETILTDMIASTFNRNAVSQLMELNGVPREYWPRIVPGSLDKPELDKLGKYITDLATSGVLSPNKALENQLLMFADLPLPEEHDDDMFNNDSIPTPQTSADQATGVLSALQIQAIMSINQALADGKIDIDAAKELAGAALNMSPENAIRFLSKSKSE